MQCDDVPAALSPHPVFAGDDLDRAREVVSSVINPHNVRVRGDRARLDVRQFASQVGAVTLSYLRYGTEVEITAPDVASCFCVQFPLGGTARVQCGVETLVASRRRASVPSPIEPLRMVWPAQAAHLILRVEQGALEQHLRGLVAGPVRDPIRMQLGLDLSGYGGARWHAIVELLKADIAQRDDSAARSVPASPASAAAIEELVLNALLLWHPNSYWDRLARHAQPASAPYVRRAVEHAQANLGGPLTVVRLADAVGVSVRALQAGFARDFGCSPSSYVRDLRLDRIHDELASAEPGDGTRVTDVALRWGFPHLGRLSQVYLERFGELPSATLRQSRPSTRAGSG